MENEEGCSIKKGRQDIPESYKGYHWATGDCDVMAKAIHEKTEQPVFVVRGTYYDEEFDEMNYEDCHVVVMIGRNQYMDYEGNHTKDDVIERCVFMHDVIRIDLVPISVEELDTVFNMEGISEEGLKIAKEFLELYGDEILGR